MSGTLGEGAFGIVRLAKWKRCHPPMTVAVKVIPKRILKGNIQLVESETNAVKELVHPNIVRLYDNFESKDKYYLVFEAAMGGEVFERVLHTGHLTEHDSAHVIKSVASALQYIHSHDFVHRDVKPENIMYKTDPDQDPEARIVLVDFGVTEHLGSEGEKLRELAGSLGYAAPEVVARTPYGKKVDIWSLGAVAYVMLSGHMPYRNGAPKQLLDEMLAGPLDFSGKYWEAISDEARDFIQGCMEVEVDQRMDATQALNHPWILHNAEVQEGQKTKPNIVHGLKENYALRPKTRAPTLAPSSVSASSSRTTTQHGLCSSEDEDEESEVNSHRADGDKTSARSVPASRTASTSGATTPVKPLEPIDPTTATDSKSSANDSAPSASTNRSHNSNSSPTNAEDAPSKPNGPTPLSPAEGGFDELLGQPTEDSHQGHLVEGMKKLLRPPVC